MHPTGNTTQIPQQFNSFSVAIQLIFLFQLHEKGGGADSHCCRTSAGCLPYYNNYKKSYSAMSLLNSSSETVFSFSFTTCL